MQQLQQTLATYRANAELREKTLWVSDEQAEANRAAYQAERVRRYKLSLIYAWRKKS
jgi:hypothetical protein